MTLDETLAALGNLPDNDVYLPKLVGHMNRAGVVPFVGAGMSAPFGFPQWTPLLRKLAAQEGLTATIEACIAAGEYEAAAEHLVARLGRIGLQDRIEANFGDHVIAGKQLAGAISLIPELSRGPVFTTNFDRVLETVFRNAGCPFEDSIYAFAAESAVTALQENSAVLLKVHGDWKDPNHRVLTSAEYTAVYGDPAAGLDLKRALPQLFYLLATRPLLFLGCSLKQDRTVSILRWVAEQVNSLHFAILEIPADPDAHRKRRAELLDSHIRPIWYPEGKHEKIEVVLRYLTEQVPEPLRRRQPKTDTLPMPGAPFIGRDDEIGEVAKQLGQTRLLTILGPPGSGKTRLAIEVARSIRPEFDRVWFVELSQIAPQDSHLVPQRVATILGIYKPGPDTPLQQVAKFLNTGKHLLVIDNSEHQVEACADLSNALRECQGLKILCTSRRKLHALGERLYDIPPLKVPAAGQGMDLDRLAQIDSVRLFLDRAGIPLTQENCRSIAALCRQLEGIPLAIELAAAQLQTLDIDQILERLNAPLELLTGGAGGVEERQWETLSKAVDLSHGMLNPSQAVFFRRLSVFRRGCRLEAAAATCGEPGLDEFTVIRLLNDLQSMSLLKVEMAAGRKRFRMLDFVRQYAAGCLDQAFEAEAVRRRHALWYADLAEKGSPELLKGNQKQWLAEFAVEADDFRAALSFCVNTHDVETGLRITGSLWRMMEIRGYLSEGIERLQSVLKLPETTGFPKWRAKALSGLGILYYRQGDIMDAEPCFDEALRLERVLENDPGIANALNDLGNVANLKTEFDAAERYFQECLEIQTRLNNDRDVTVALYNLGKIALRQGFTDKALGLIRDACDRFEETGNLREAAFARNGLALVALRLGDLPEAQRQADVSLKYREDLKDNNGAAETKRTLAAIRIEHEEFAGAYGLLWESAQTCRELGNRLGLAECFELFARLAMRCQDPEACAGLYAAADKLRAELHTPVAPIDAAARLPDISAAQAALGQTAFERASHPARAWSIAQALGASANLRSKAASI